MTLSWARLDDAGGQVRFPVEPLARLLEERSGESLPTADPAAATGVMRRSQHPPLLGVEEEERPLLDSSEYDVAAMRDPDGTWAAHVVSDTRLARCVRADRLRYRERQHNVYTGLVALDAEAGDTLSITTLELLARCPFRYLLERVLGLARPDEPEELDGPGALELGRLVHRILEDFFRPLVGETPPEEAATDKQLARLRRLVKLRIDEARAQGALGAPALLEAAGGKLRLALETFVYDELAALRESGLVVAAVESAEERELQLGAHALRLVGRPDRVDLDTDGGRHVVDYKWSDGSQHPSTKRGVLFAGGQQLQLPLYAWLLAKDEEDGPLRGLRYAFLRAAKRRSGVLDLAELDKRSGELPELVAKLAALPRSGELIPTPRDGETCRACDFVGVCGPWRARIEAHKSEDDTQARIEALAKEHP